jgi:hypothetical protein
MPQRFGKVKNLPDYHRKGAMDTTASEYQQREIMSPVCGILLNVTNTDDKRRQDISRRDGPRRWQDDQDWFASLAAQWKSVAGL